jgi:TPR repeat protein
VIDILNQSLPHYNGSSRKSKKVSGMTIKRLIAFIGMIFLVTSCSTDKYGNTFYGFGHSTTMTDTGVKYLLGRGVPKDNEKAFYYFTQAAEEGDPLADNELGYMYAAGKGTPRNNEKAFFHYQRAARHGLASAQYSLGMLYLNGIGTPRNKSLAMDMFNESAKAGFEPARVALTRYSK